MTTSQPPKRLEPWPQAVVEQIARVIGETSGPFSGTQIGQLLTENAMTDPLQGGTKWRRLYAALIDSHNHHQGPKRIVTFLTKAMAPVRYTDSPASFTALQDALNEVLVHVGLRINNEGKVARGPQASTLSEAAEHANSLRSELRRRGTHQEVLRYCTKEILERNTFHAMLEAVKGVADRLRSLSGQTGDGARLVDATLMIGQQGKPRLAINAGVTPSDLDEQKGFANLCRGVFSMYRNPTAHEPRISRETSDEELLEALTVVSLIQRRLDNAVVGD